MCIFCQIKVEKKSPSHGGIKGVFYAFQCNVSFPGNMQTQGKSPIDGKIIISNEANFKLLPYGDTVKYVWEAVKLLLNIDFATN